jgi:hypothetical protein
MSKTIWTKNVKETFAVKKSVAVKDTPSNPESEPVSEPFSNNSPNFGSDVYIGNDSDDVILQNHNTPTDKPQPQPHAAVAETPPPPSLDKTDPAAAFNFYKSAISSIKHGAENFKHIIAELIGGSVFSDLDSPDAKKDLAILSSQIARLFAVIPMSYIMVLNWWYLMCYTNYTIDFRNYSFKHLPIKYVTMPSAYALEFLNYYTLTFRMNKSSTWASYYRELWNWRPIIFSLCHLLVAGPMIFLPVGNVLEYNMVNFGILSIVVMVLAIYYFANFFMSDQWYATFMPISIGSFLGLVAFLIMSILGMLIFIAVVCPIYIFYITFLFSFAICWFNGFWPPSIYSICNQIFQELKEAPLDNDNPTTKKDKLKNAAFQNFHSIYLLVVLIYLLGTNINESMSFKNEALIVIAVIANILICGVTATSVFELPFIFRDIFFEEKGNSTPEPASMPEGEV